jgi:hypothetical protein
MPSLNVSPSIPETDRLQLSATDLQRHSAPVVALKLQKVERNQRRLSRAAVGPQRREVAVSIRPEDNGFAVDQGVVDGQGADGLGDSQKGVAIIRCISGPENDSASVLAGQESVAVVLYFVDPLRPRSRGCRKQRAGRANETGRRRAPGTRRSDAP